MSLTPSFYHTPELTGTMAKWKIYKDETEYRDEYSRQKLAEGVPELRTGVADLEGTLRTMPLQTGYGSELRTLSLRNTQPVSSWPHRPTMPPGTTVLGPPTMR
eukprot:gene12505-15719_t